MIDSVPTGQKKWLPGGRSTSAPGLSGQLSKPESPLFNVSCY